MSWRDDPATEKQIGYLLQFGHQPERALTKGEACDLIAQFSEDPERVQIRDQEQIARTAQEFEERQRNLAYYIHQELDGAIGELSQAKRGEIQDYRLEVRQIGDARIIFWKDTFRDIAEMEAEDFSEQCANLYTEFGYRFRMPSKEQIQNVLNALDAALPTWDRDKPQLFHETLELNFPELLR